MPRAVLQAGTTASKQLVFSARSSCTAEERSPDSISPCLTTAAALQTKSGTVGFFSEEEQGFHRRHLDQLDCCAESQATFGTRHGAHCVHILWFSMRKPPQQKASAQSEQCITFEISCQVYPTDGFHYSRQLSLLFWVAIFIYRDLVSTLLPIRKNS